MILSEDMKRVVEQQSLGFVATVTPDGRPNLSPKGTTIVWDDSALMFADVASPQTVANLRLNPTVDINVVDPIVRKGYRFRGTASVHTDGANFDRGCALLRARGSTLTDRVRSIVVVDVTDARPVISPAYETAVTEQEVAARWLSHHLALRRDAAPPAAAVLLAGHFGVGKSTVTADMATVLEDAGVPFAAVDLDWLMWSNIAGPSRADGHALMLANVAALIASYRGRGATHFVLAHSIRDADELASLRETLAMPLRTVELTVPFDIVADRLAADPTQERRDNLRVAADWRAQGLGTDLADIVVANDRPIRDVARDIMRWLGWPH